MRGFGTRISRWSSARGGGSSHCQASPWQTKPGKGNMAHDATTYDELRDRSVRLCMSGSRGGKEVGRGADFTRTYCTYKTSRHTNGGGRRLWPTPSRHLSKDLSHRGSCTRCFMAFSWRWQVDVSQVGGAAFHPNKDRAIVSCKG